jgi:20S proteasome subunit alpha 5
MDLNCIVPLSVGNGRYHAEPSGTFYRYDAKAIGSGSEGAQAELQNEYFKVFCLRGTL